MGESVKRNMPNGLVIVDGQSSFDQIHDENDDRPIGYFQAQHSRK